MSVVDKTAMKLDITKWDQGETTNIDREWGKVIFNKIFQVNCPGNFL